MKGVVFLCSEVGEKNSHRYEDLRKEGLKGFGLIKIGALERLNPILMTAFTTGLALISLTLKGGEPGSEIQGPMAPVILGGLLSATLLNLVVIPCVYELVTRKNKRGFRPTVVKV